MKTAPLPDNEKERLAALDTYGLLDTPPEAIYDAITRLAASICDAPIALISLVDRNRQWFKSAHGLPGITETGREIAFCAHAILEPELLEVMDALEDERFHDNPLVFAEPKIRFYAGAPLESNDGLRLGTLCVIDRKPRQLSDQQKQALASLRDLVIELFEHRRNPFSSRLGRMMDRASVEIFIFDAATWKCLDANEEALRNTGYDSTTLRGLAVTDVVAGIAASSLTGSLDELAEGEHRQLRFEAEQRRADGSRYPVEIQLQRSRYGEQTVLLALVTDISERRRFEAGLESARRELDERASRIQFLMNSVAGAIFSLDPDGLCTFCNASAAELLGYGRPEELLGRNMHELTHYAHADGTPYPESECLIRVAFRKGDRSHVDREVLWRKDGSCFPAEYWSYPLRDGGEIVGAVVTFLDITQRLERESRERAQDIAREQVARLNMAGEMAAGLAHELNQPLTAIAQYLDAAVSVAGQVSRPDPELLAILREAGAEAVRAGDIVRQMRRMVRKSDPETTMTDLGVFLQETFPLIEPETREHDIQIDLQVAPDVPPVAIDRVQMQQVVINLLRNAVQSLAGADAGERRIVVSVAPEDHGVAIAIEDNGPGVPEQIRQHLFEQFQTSKADGMGLGLSISRSIVERHHGQLWLEPAPRGARFVFTLPVRVG